MGITSLYNKTCTVERLAVTTGAKKEYASHLTGVLCHIQPLTSEYANAGDFIFGKDWLLFCDIVDIQEGDRITEGGVEYRVISVESLDFQGRQPHNEVVIRVFEQA